MDFQKFNNIFFFSKLFFLLYDKTKNKQLHNQVQLKNKYPAKPANQENHSYLVKLVNPVIDSTKFINLVSFNYFLFNYTFKKINHTVMMRYFSDTNLMLRFFLILQ